MKRYLFVLMVLLFFTSGLQASVTFADEVVYTGVSTVTLKEFDTYGNQIGQGQFDYFTTLIVGPPVSAGGLVESNDFNLFISSEEASNTLGGFFMKSAAVLFSGSGYFVDQSWVYSEVEPNIYVGELAKLSNDQIITGTDPLISSIVLYEPNRLAKGTEIAVQFIDASTVEFLVVGITNDRQYSFVIGGTLTTTTPIDLSTPAPQPTNEPTPTESPVSGSALSAPQNVQVNLTTDGTSINPQISWNSDTNAQWFNIYVIAPDGRIVVDNKWVSKQNAMLTNPQLSLVSCGSGVCSVTLPEGIVGSGSYQVWMQSWGTPDGTTDSGRLSSVGGNPQFPGWSMATFTIPKTGSPSNVAYNNSTGVITWTTASGASWYQIWVGTIKNGIPVQAQFQTWIAATALGCQSSSTCSLPLSISASGNYSIWISSWGPGGYSNNDVANQGWVEMGQITVP